LRIKNCVSLRQRLSRGSNNKTPISLLNKRKRLFFAVQSGVFSVMVKMDFTLFQLEGHIPIYSELKSLDQILSCGNELSGCIKCGKFLD
jgi:hypothetical protein